MIAYYALLYWHLILPPNNSIVRDYLPQTCLYSILILQEYENGDENGALNQEYVENKVEELEFAIRREEVRLFPDIF